MNQAILTTLVLNFFEDLTGRFENVLHTLACLHLSNPLDAAGGQETFTAGKEQLV